MSVLLCLWKYIQLKEDKSFPLALKELGKPITKRVVILAGKGTNEQDGLVNLMLQVQNIINNDTELGDALKVIFIPDFNVTTAQKIIPAADVFENLTTPGAMQE